MSWRQRTLPTTSSCQRMLRPLLLVHVAATAALQLATALPVTQRAQPSSSLARASANARMAANSDLDGDMAGVSYYEDKLCDADEEDTCALPDDDEFTVAILGDLVRKLCSNPRCRRLPPCR